MTEVTTPGNPRREGLPSGRSPHVLPWAAALVTVVLWASAFVAIRHLGDDFSPGALTLGRLVLGSLVLGVVLATRSPRWPSRQHWPRLLICGIGWFGIYNVSLNAAETRVDAGTAAMLVSIGPIVVAVLAGWLLKEGFPRQLVAGSAVAFAGVIVIGTATSSRDSSDMWGVLLCALAAIAFALAVVAQKPLLASLACPRGDLVGLHHRHGGQPAVRPGARARDRRSGRVRDRVARLPRRAADGPRVHDLGLRPGPHDRRTAGRDDVPRAAHRHRARLGTARRGTAALAFVGGALCLAGVYVARRVPRGARLRS